MGAGVRVRIRTVVNGFGHWGAMRTRPILVVPATTAILALIKVGEEERIVVAEAIEMRKRIGTSRGEECELRPHASGREILAQAAERVIRSC